MNRTPHIFFDHDGEKSHQLNSMGYIRIEFGLPVLFEDRMIDGNIRLVVLKGSKQQPDRMMAKAEYKFRTRIKNSHKNQIWSPSHPHQFDYYGPSSFLRNSLMMKSKTSNGKTKHSAPRSRTSSSESRDGPSAMLDEEFTLDIQGTN